MRGCFLHAPYWGLAWPAAQACALTGNGPSNPLVRRIVLSPLSHTSQGPIIIFNKRFSEGVKIKTKIILLDIHGSKMRTEPKGHWFDSQSGLLQARSPVGGT